MQSLMAPHFSERNSSASTYPHTTGTVINTGAGEGRGSRRGRSRPEENAPGPELPAPRVPTAHSSGAAENG